MRYGIFPTQKIKKMHFVKKKKNQNVIREDAELRIHLLQNNQFQSKNLQKGSDIKETLFFKKGKNIKFSLTPSYVFQQRLVVGVEGR